jgi:hypothetical protein
VVGLLGYRQWPGEVKASRARLWVLRTWRAMCTRSFITTSTPRPRLYGARAAMASVGRVTGRSGQ